jgi:glycerophosphoryl diester phosphodiesterase
MQDVKTRIWAHRGASAYAPDNTMPAFQLAVKMKADGIEIDTHLSKDGIPVLCHDETLDNISDGTGRVRDFTVGQLRKLNFNRSHPQIGKVGIVTLEEFYIFARRYGIYVNTELKYYDREKWEELNVACLKIAERTGMEDSILYSSFNHPWLSELKKREPTAKIGLLYSDYIEAPWLVAKEFNADALHPWYGRIYEQDLVNQCHKSGIMVNPWTIDNPDDIKKSIDLKVDAVITNKPDLALEIRY